MFPIIHFNCDIKNVVLQFISTLGNFLLTSEMARSFNIKQIMTGLEGNRQIYLPREIQDRLPKSFY